MINQFPNISRFSIREAFKNHALMDQWVNRTSNVASYIKESLLCYLKLWKYARNLTQECTMPSIQNIDQLVPNQLCIAKFDH